MILVLEIKQINVKKPKFDLTSWFEGHYYIAEDREVKSNLDLLNIKIYKNFGLLRSQDNCIRISKNNTMTRPASMFESKDELIKFFKSKLNYLINSEIFCIYIYDNGKVSEIKTIDADFPDLLHKVTYN